MKSFPSFALDALSALADPIASIPVKAATTLDEGMCRDCAADANAPWPIGATGTCIGPCHWCGNGDRALMPFSDLETDFAELNNYA